MFYSWVSFIFNHFYLYFILCVLGCGSFASMNQNSFYFNIFHSVSVQSRGSLDSTSSLFNLALNWLFVATLHTSIHVTVLSAVVTNRMCHGCMAFTMPNVHSASTLRNYAKLNSLGYYDYVWYCSFFQIFKVKLEL